MNIEKMILYFCKINNVGRRETSDVINRVRAMTKKGIDEKRIIKSLPDFAKRAKR